MSLWSHLSVDHFATAFGLHQAAADAHLKRNVAACTFDYRLLTGEEEEATISRIAADIETGRFSVVGAQRAGIWEDAWRQTLERFQASGHQLESLNPTFMGTARLVRLGGHYAEVRTPDFELRYFEVFRDWLFRTWLSDFDAAIEFGCGSGFNLAALAKVQPGLAITGYDWSASAAAIADLIGQKHGLPVRGGQFDFFAPPAALTMPANTAVLTMCALEQVGDRFGPFLDFLLDRAPRRVVHMEPILDFYDPANPVDAMAIAYHRRRGYLSGYMTRLTELAGQGRIRILAARRLGFGSQYHEGFSYIIWEPS